MTNPDDQIVKAIAMILWFAVVSFYFWRSIK